MLSPCPTYHGCAGDILTPYIAAPHSTSSFSSSSDPDVASLIALPFSWAAQGRLAGELGDFLTRLHPLLAFPEETRVSPFPLSHLTHMAGCFLLHSCGVKSFCFADSTFPTVIHMTDRTRYHHPSSSTSDGVSVTKCTCGMKKMYSPAAFSNATLGPIHYDTLHRRRHPGCNAGSPGDWRHFIKKIPTPPPSSLPHLLSRGATHRGLALSGGHRVHKIEI